MALDIKSLIAVSAAVGLASLFYLQLQPETSKATPTDVQTKESEPASPPTELEQASSVPSTTATRQRTAPQPVRSAEDSLAELMHQLEPSNPAAALELARQGQTRWPTGPRAAEFAATEVKCLYLLGRPSEGRGAAEAMVNKYRNSPWALEVERETGAHPYVNH